MQLFTIYSEYNIALSASQAYRKWLTHFVLNRYARLKGRIKTYLYNMSTLSKGETFSR